MNMDSVYCTPPGFRFRPEDSLIMLKYLLWKKQGHPYANLFKDVPLYDYDPDELRSKFGPEKEDEWYVFYTTPEPRMKRKAGNGRWKVITGEKEIVNCAGNLMGYSNKLSYRPDGRDVRKETTGWNMVEYRLACANGKRKRNMDGLFFCKIYKSRGSRKPREAPDDEGLRISSMSMTSNDSVECPTSVTNRKDQFDVNSKECVENKCQLPDFSSMADFNSALKCMTDFLGC